MLEKPKGEKDMSGKFSLEGEKNTSGSFQGEEHTSGKD